MKFIGHYSFLSGLSYYEQGLLNCLTYRFASNGKPRIDSVTQENYFLVYVEDQNDTTMESYALAEGIVRWVNAGEDYVEMMDG